ncbi:3-methyladenine DNA glycosylase/8-oxoguanine DNA glycosylase [Nocardioides luteus]|uniref:3-methyladenine DNA glycosylase n=1 Tax=Nocardioides luteus TaxID=1844 RepID=A0ABQ5SZ64_9ACTN|nr:DNA-3-methyladenine glycosylase 2 family protein [Nocardioides luteus]MDR7310733.1 3-methyladenine DNA glycosylase/8-oxoguanine DNA glycosylase [Nocardioides luteus]GGR40973.1 3-methyladenine DNA glycosylase [Nocardioides luteus]GLJ69487.1 3-methyladenine DNA glycosylase [Nocardioides luteus]
MSSQRTVRPGYPVGVASMLRPLRRGPGDPTYKIIGEDHWRAVRTPQGTATLRLRQRGTEVESQAWGEGAEWVLEQVPALLGAEDRPEEFHTDDPLLAGLLERFEVPRFGRTQLMMEALVPAIIEQKVTSQEAFRGFGAMVRRFGEVAPGPDHGLRVQPSPQTLRTIPSWDWLRMPVDPARSKAVLQAARVASAIERTVDLAGDEVERRLTTIPGIGEWTVAEVRQRALGDPDAVSFGDYHIAKDMGWALTNQTWSDDQLREYLEKFRPHRGRVVALVYRAAGKRPRRGPRMSPRTHLPR